MRPHLTLLRLVLTIGLQNLYELLGSPFYFSCLIDTTSDVLQATIPTSTLIGSQSLPPKSSTSPFSVLGSAMLVLKALRGTPRDLLEAGAAADMRC
jgi:hypothetical protein